MCEPPCLSMKTLAGKLDGIRANTAGMSHHMTQARLVVPLLPVVRPSCRRRKHNTLSNNGWTGSGQRGQQGMCVCWCVSVRAHDEYRTSTHTGKTNPKSTRTESWNTRHHVQRYDQRVPHPTGRRQFGLCHRYQDHHRLSVPLWHLPRTDCLGCRWSWTDSDRRGTVLDNSPYRTIQSTGYRASL